ncbi:MAG: M12 family metallopeptidase [Phycisphaerae bacterium]
MKMTQPGIAFKSVLVLVMVGSLTSRYAHADDGPEIPRGYKLVDDMIVEEDFGTPARGTHQANLWPGGVVPYEFDANVTQLNQDRTLAAMAEWESVALVDFVPLTTQSNYVHIQSGSGNNSFVGTIGGGQTLNMFNWSVKFIIVHELGHALGLVHEQQAHRPQSLHSNQYEQHRPQFAWKLQHPGVIISLRRLRFRIDDALRSVRICHVFVFDKLQGDYCTPAL